MASFADIAFFADTAEFMEGFIIARQAAVMTFDVAGSPMAFNTYVGITARTVFYAALAGFVAVAAHADSTVSADVAGRMIAGVALIVAAVLTDHMSGRVEAACAEIMTAGIFVTLRKRQFFAALFADVHAAFAGARAVAAFTDVTVSADGAGAVIIAVAEEGRTVLADCMLIV